MNDLEIATRILLEKDLTLVIVKNGVEIFQTDSHRISGFIKAIDILGTQLATASVADRVAGKALALLCVYSQVQAVYAEVMSKKAKSLFDNYKISCEGNELVDNVLDVEKKEVCPFERIAEKIKDPEQSYSTFKALLEKMRACLNNSPKILATFIRLKLVIFKFSKI